MASLADLYASLYGVESDPISSFSDLGPDRRKEANMRGLISIAQAIGAAPPGRMGSGIAAGWGGMDMSRRQAVEEARRRRAEEAERQRQRTLAQIQALQAQREETSRQKSKTRARARDEWAEENLGGGGPPADLFEPGQYFPYAAEQAEQRRETTAKQRKEQRVQAVLQRFGIPSTGDSDQDLELATTAIKRQSFPEPGPQMTPGQIADDRRQAKDQELDLTMSIADMLEQDASRNAQVDPVLGEGGLAGGLDLPPGFAVKDTPVRPGAEEILGKARGIAQDWLGPERESTQETFVGGNEPVKDDEEDDYGRRAPTRKTEPNRHQVSADRILRSVDVPPAVGQAVRADIIAALADGDSPAKIRRELRQDLREAGFLD